MPPLQSPLRTKAEVDDGVSPAGVQLVQGPVRVQPVEGGGDQAAMLSLPVGLLQGQHQAHFLHLAAGQGGISVRGLPQGQGWEPPRPLNKAGTPLGQQQHRTTRKTLRRG